MFSTLLSDRVQTISLSNPPKGLEFLFGGGPTKSGVSVDEKRSLGLSAIWCAVLNLSRIKASLPLHVYRENPGGWKEKDITHPLYRMLHNKPNELQTAYNFRQLLSVHQYIWGAGIAEIEFDGAGNPRQLWPIPPWRVVPMYTTNYNPIYQVTMKDGSVRWLWPYQLLIFPFMQTCSHGWLSPIQIHRETLGASIAVKEFGARTFGQGVNPAGIVSGVALGDEKHEESLRERFGGYEGLGQSHRLMLLEDGEEFKRVGLPPEDAQYLEAQRFGIAEIARIYNIPLHMLHETAKSTSWGSGISEQVRGLIKFNIGPDCTMWEQEINSKLFDGYENFCEFSMQAMLRGSAEERFGVYKTGIETGIYTINECRRLENMAPVEDGDKQLISQNLRELKQDMEANDE